MKSFRQYLAEADQLAAPAADVDPSETALKSAQVDPKLMKQVEDNTVHDAELARWRKIAGLA